VYSTARMPRPVCQVTGTSLDDARWMINSAQSCTVTTELDMHAGLWSRSSHVPDQFSAKLCRSKNKWVDKDEVREAKLWDADKHHNKSTKRRSGAQLVANLNFNFPQVVRKHTLGVVGHIIRVLFAIYSSFQRWKRLKIG